MYAKIKKFLPQTTPSLIFDVNLFSLLIIQSKNPNSIPPKPNMHIMHTTSITHEFNFQDSLRYRPEPIPVRLLNALVFNWLLALRVVTAIFHRNAEYCK